MKFFKLWSKVHGRLLSGRTPSRLDYRTHRLIGIRLGRLYFGFVWTGKG